MSRKTLVLLIVLFWISPGQFLRAETMEPSAREFSISPSQDWIELPLPFRGVVVSYGKKGTLATFHITERKLDEDKTVPMPINRSKAVPILSNRGKAEIGAVPTTINQEKIKVGAEIGAVLTAVDQKKEKVRTADRLSWEDLFSPEFGSIDIHTQSTTVLGGEKAKFCIYTLKPGEFKKNMEGNLPGKYINYVLIHEGKLFSITFKDTEDGFALTYPSFLAAIRTLRFGAPPPAPQRKSP